MQIVVADNREGNEILIIGHARTEILPDYVTPKTGIDAMENMTNEVDILLELDVSL